MSETVGQKLDATLANLATKDDLAAALDAQKREIVRDVIAAINAHTDRLIGDLRTDLNVQGVRVPPLGKKAG